MPSLRADFALSAAGVEASLLSTVPAFSYTVKKKLCLA